ncbi:TPA: UDP-N-acetylenolpyruvoylglucosamine reductase [Candidatus Berkelbacteria bacterium]|uniref:UDP-N-acetylenolpyruvoylglucosamine reductase n=1 Tax=Berkelbacteria bacterium GW2011_GWE1_39_12 TaxID=1618337 RepID=A0A0G4B4J6_9BACT|nr:MAG: UDP-N-acetylenolpyruvoylglucosamine reductase, UDP-N-acetylmuramate dehydrogenase [Berkelbacteria bacterium GW2011_GWE1_39_12]HBO60499.1 UDP-N-acetylenolpyruvoylglucosamine reductase [Candidatus Berkelbacteria bacterium]
MNKAKLLAEILKPGFREHELMRDHTTIQVGGVADFYYEANSIDDIVNAVKAAKKICLPYFILGGGSNVIFSDYGFPGLVVKNNAKNISFMNEKSQVIVDGGVPMSKLILEATSNNLSGLEFLYGIPGTVGGAVYGNAGAHGQSIGDFVKNATILIPGEENEEPQIIQVDNKWFEFSYRSSKLKKIPGLKKPVVLTLKIQLAQNRQEEIMRRLNSVKKTRWDTQPVGMSAGCIFKNPLPETLVNVSGRGSKNMPEFPKERTAGYMLDHAGAKKLKNGNVRVSSKHANFIVNSGNAKAQEVRQLAEQMRDVVQKKYNVNLNEEVEYVGQW